MTTAKNVLKDLAKEVDQRQKLIERVVKFVEALVLKRGELIAKVVGSSNTRTKRLLTNFGDFSFFVDDGQTMFGGTEVVVWYHPKQVCNPSVILPKLDNGMLPHLVFEAYYQDLADCKVRKFDNNTLWVKALNCVIKNETKIAKRLKKERKKLELLQEKEDREREQIEKLEKTKERLCL